MNTAPFFRKWLNDMADRQEQDGMVHSIVPMVGNEWLIGAMDDCVGWADASIFIPYRLYQMFGDEIYLRRYYPSMRAFAEFSIRRASRHLSRTGSAGTPTKNTPTTASSISASGESQKAWRSGNFIANIILPKPEEATAYFHNQMRFMSEVAKILGLKADCTRYAEYAGGVKKAYNYLFVKDGTVDTDRQAKLVRPLAIGLQENRTKTNVENRLEKAPAHNDWEIGTGFLSIPFILPVLTTALRS